MTEKKDRPKSVIFCTKSLLQWATAIKISLKEETECVIWNQEVFSPGKSFSDSIEELLYDIDFSICILGDTLNDNNVSSGPSLDLIYEVAASQFSVGSERTFVLLPKDVQIERLPIYMRSVKNVQTNITHLNNKELISSVQEFCFEISQRIRCIGPRPGRKSVKIQYAGAICYKTINQKIMIRCINSTAGRLVIPKGRIDRNEMVTDAALRHAHDEGGVVGEILGQDIFTFYHIKKNPPEKEQEVAVKIVKCIKETEPRAKFRNPRWVDWEEARDLISHERTWLYAKEARKLIDSAVDAIRINLKPVIQVGVIPFRSKEREMELLLLTSKRSRRWLFPKGNLPDGTSATDHAIKEAYEEAGITGRILPHITKEYTYERNGIVHNVILFPMKVEEIMVEWPERSQREREWFNPKDAIERVFEDSLKDIVYDIDNSPLGNWQ